MTGKISLRPTRLAGPFSLLVLVMLGAAINYGNNLSFIIAFILIGIAVNTAWQTRRQLSGLMVTPQSPPPRHADEVGWWPIVLLAVDRPRYGLYVQADANAVSIRLEANQAQSLNLPLALRPRGRHALPAIRIETSYPLGLWLARAEWQSGQYQWVYPRPAGNLPLPPARNLEGVAVEQDLAGDEEFDSLRSYTPGDPLTRIAFKRSALLNGELLTKVFAGTPAGGETLDLDYSRLEGEPEQRLSQLASWILQAEKAGQPYSLTLPRQKLAAGLGTSHQRRCMEALTTFQPERSHG